MKKLKVLVALTNSDNDYQLEQAAAAEEAARRLGIEVQVIDADNDGIGQSQQLLKVIQSAASSHPDAIVFEPVGATALPHVARAAATAGIAWVVLNRDVDYLTELRRTYPVPIFAISSDQELTREADRERWLHLPFTGCDGLQKTGQAWVRSGLLAATIYVPPNAGRALEMLVQAMHGNTKPPECKLTVPTSFPSIEQLAASRWVRAQTEAARQSAGR